MIPLPSMWPVRKLRITYNIYVLCDTPRVPISLYRCKLWTAIGRGHILYLLRVNPADDTLKFKSLRVHNITAMMEYNMRRYYEHIDIKKYYIVIQQEHAALLTTSWCVRCLRRTRRIASHTHNWYTAAGTTTAQTRPLLKRCAVVAE